MKNTMMVVGLAVLLLVGAAGVSTSRAGENKVGGYATADVTDKQVVATADFAVKAISQALAEKHDAAAGKLELVKIVSAQQQVVAGMNYRLVLQLKVADGKEKTAEAVVWWQAWRTPDPYQLSSWQWQ